MLRVINGAREGAAILGSLASCKVLDQLEAEGKLQQGSWPLRREIFMVTVESKCGSKCNHQGTAGCGLWFHLSGFHFGLTFLTHSQVLTACWLTDEMCLLWR